MNKDQKDALQHLEKLVCAVSTLRRDGAFLARASITVVPSASDLDVACGMARWWAEHAPMADVDRHRAKPALADDARRLLMQVANHPNEYSSHHYRALAWSLATGTRVRKKLEDDKLIKVHRIVTGRRGGSPEIIELLEPAYDKLGLTKPQQTGKGASFEHSWWSARIKSWLEANHA